MKNNADVLEFTNLRDLIEQLLDSDYTYTILPVETKVIKKTELLKDNLIKINPFLSDEDFIKQVLPDMKDYSGIRLSGDGAYDRYDYGNPDDNVYDVFSIVKDTEKRINIYRVLRTPKRTKTPTERIGDTRFTTHDSDVFRYMTLLIKAIEDFIHKKLTPDETKTIVDIYERAKERKEKGISSTEPEEDDIDFIPGIDDIDDPFINPGDETITPTGDEIVPEGDRPTDDDEKNITNAPDLPNETPEKAKEKKNVIRNTRKFKLKKGLFSALFVGSILSSILSGLGKNSETEVVNEDVIETEYSVEEIKENILKYGVLSEEDLKNMDLSDEEIINILKSINLGDEIFIENGQKMRVTSKTGSEYKTMGEEFSKENKFEGNYNVSGFSVVDKDGNTIVDAEEAFSGEYDKYSENDMDNLYNFVMATLEEHNLTLDDVNISLHFGLNQDITRLGWENIEGIINEKNPELFENIQREQFSFSGTEHNFEGDTITFKDQNGMDVTINVTDGKGNLLQAGDKVKGSDGNIYEISSLSLTEQTKYVTKEEQVTKTISYEKEVEKGISWSFKNISLLPAALGLSALLGALAYQKKKNKEESENPQYEEFFNHEAYKEFVELTTNYEQNSNYSKAKKNLTVKEKLSNFLFSKVDNIQLLDEDQKLMLFDLIMSKAEEMGITSIDDVFVSHNEFYIISNGERINIPLNIRDYSNIGKENDIAITGLVPDEYDNGLEVGGLRK